MLKKAGFKHLNAPMKLFMCVVKLSQMKYGERSELPEIKEDSPVWPYVTQP